MTAGAMAAGGDDPQCLRTLGPAAHHPWRDPTKDSDEHARTRFTQAANLPGPEMLRELYLRAWQREHGRPWCAADGALLVDGEPPGPHVVELGTVLIRAMHDNDKPQFIMKPGCPEAVPSRLTKDATISIEGDVYTITSAPTQPNGRRPGGFKIVPKYQGACA